MRGRAGLSVAVASASAQMKCVTVRDTATTAQMSRSKTAVSFKDVKN